MVRITIVVRGVLPQNHRAGRGILCDNNPMTGKSSAGRRLIQGTVALGSLTVAMGLVAYVLAAQAGRNLSQVNQFYLPGLKHLSAMNGAWGSYRKALDRDIQFHRWGEKGLDLPTPRINLQRTLAPNIQGLTELSADGSDSMARGTAALKEITLRAQTVANLEAQRLAELAVLVKNRRVEDAARQYMALRGDHMALSHALNVAARDFETAAAQMQLSAERQVNLANGALLFALGLCFVAVTIMALRMGHWLAPIMQWQQALSTMATQIAAGGFADLRAKVKLPATDRTMPSELASLAHEIGNMATTVMEHEKTIQHQKTKLESLNVHLKERNHVLRKLGSLNERILNAITSGMLVVDEGGRVEQFNESFCRLFDRPKEDVMGAEALALLEPFGPQHPQPWLSAEGPLRERRVRDARGRLFDVTVELLEGRGRVLSFEDVTALVEQEERLAHASKLALAGDLSAQVAHEVRNPLNSMMLQLEMLADDCAASDGAARRVQQVMGQVERLERLTEKYLQVPASAPSQGGAAKGQAEAVGLHDLIERTLAFCSAEIQARGVQMDLAFAAEEIPLRADGDRLTQVLLNLVTNALEALDDAPAGRRRIRIETSLKELESGGHAAVLRIEDSGSGVPATIQERLFEPFVTAKARGHGLGLSTARQICLDHGGELRFEGHSRFEMSLPV